MPEFRAGGRPSRGRGFKNGPRSGRVFAPHTKNFRHLTIKRGRLKLVIILNFNKGLFRGGALAGKKKRMTVQRQVVLEELKKLKTHPSADELYQKVRQRIPRISLGTVYRNLESLVEEGLALRLDAGPGPSRYDGFTKKHYHIQCVNCYRLDDIMLKLKPEPKWKYPRLSDYAVQGFKVEFFGVCPTCLKQQQNFFSKKTK